MSDDTIHGADMDVRYLRYLALLGLNAVRPDAFGLRQIVRRHLIAVPFENVSKRLRARQGMSTIPDVTAFLDGVERHGFGGTCYANNYHLYRLLRHVGFDVRLCGGDMAHASDVHMATIVRCENREYIVDCGFGAPFLEPLSADLQMDHVVSLGTERYVLHPRDAAGISRLDFFRGGVPRYGYALKPAARRLRDFSGVIAASCAPDAHFMKTLQIVRFSEDGAISLRGHTLTHNIVGQSSTEVLDEADLPGVVEQVFGISADAVRKATAAPSSHAR